MTSMVTAIIPVLFGLGYFCLNNNRFLGLLIPIGVSLICFGISVLIGFYVLCLNKYVYIDPFELIQLYHDQKLTNITLKTASTWAALVNENKEYHDSRAKQYKLMLITIGFGMVNLIFIFWLAISTLLIN